MNTFQHFHSHSACSKQWRFSVVFSCDLGQNLSLKASSPGSSEHFPTAADRNELKVVWICAEVSGYSECWYLWLHLPRSGRHLAPPPTQTVSAGPELIPTYNWNQNERKNPQKVATAPAASSRQSRLIFLSSYAAGAERCTRGGPQSDNWSTVWSWDG